jgi:hypothetical protein
MNGIVEEQTENGVPWLEISDEALEAAAFVEKIGAYTAFAWCTQFTCPG